MSEKAKIYDLGDMYAVQQQFDTAGHVGMDLGQLNLAAEALTEINMRPIRLKPRSLGEQVAHLPNFPDISRQAQACKALFRALQERARALGHSLEAEAGWKTLTQMIAMQAGSRGKPHYDNSSLDEVTAITNLEGVSTLRVWDSNGEVGYDLKPGVAAFIRGKALKHQGVGDPNQTRTSLAISRIKSPTG